MISAAINGRTSRALWWGALAVSFALAFVMRPLHLPDEGRYVGVAWEMLRAQDWLVPTLNGMPYFHKPPLFYWITGQSLALFGSHEWAGRIAPLLGASVAAFALYRFLLRWAHPRIAGMTLAALLVQPLFFIGAQFANTDMLVAGCITLGIVCAAHAALCLEQGLPWRLALTAAWLSCALGVLAKGLIGIVLPAAVVVVWLLWRGQWKTVLRLMWPPGIVLFVCVTAPWFVLVQRIHTEFLDYFFLEQHVRRFATEGFNNIRPVWFYVTLLAITIIPYLPALIRRPSAKEAAPRSSSPMPIDQPSREPGVERDIMRLMLCWLGVITVFFSIPHSKLVGYILPTLPALAALCAMAAVRWPASRLADAPPRRAWTAAIAVSGLLNAALAWGAALYPNQSFSDIKAELLARHRPGEPVMMMGRYDFDARFYAQLTEPVQVYNDWDNAAFMALDSAHKELADAGRFNPALSKRILRVFSAFEPSLCESPVSWVIASADAGETFAVLRVAQRLVESEHGAIWRVDRSEPKVAALLNCQQPQ